MKKFKQLVKELPAKKVVFTFGRFQPPTTGHGLLVAAVKHLADKQGADHVIYASKTQDKKSNPLPVDRKVYYLKRMFPGANFIAASTDVPTFIQAAKQLNKKYKNIVMVAGSDRVAEYQKILNKYNGKDFHFDTVEVVSAGERDPDADGASGMSGTKMREAAKKGDFDLFKKGLPSTLTTIDAKRLMNEIREGMGQEQIKEKVELPKDDIREAYHRGDIYNIGDIVESNGQVYQIEKRGSNHLLLREQSGGLVNKWLQDVQQSDKEFVLEGTLQEMKYTSSDKIKVARVIAGALGVEDVEKSSNAEQLVNVGLRKVRSKPMRPEYVDVLHNMLQTARDAGIKFDEKLVPQKAQHVEEAVKTPAQKRDFKSMMAGAMSRDDYNKKHKLGKYAEKNGKSKLDPTGVYHKLIKTVGEEAVVEGTKQPNGTDKVGDASAVLTELSPETLKSYIPKAMGSKSAADFTRGVKMAQGSGGEEELRKKSEKRSTGIHTAIKKLTKEDLEEAEYWKNKSWQKKMADAAKKERQAREKKETEQVKEETLDEGKMGELHDTISRHLDKHISDFKSGHTGMDQFGSKVLAAHKAVAKEHGLEHKHAVKHVNDYVDSKLNESLEEGKDYSVTVNHYKDGVKTDHEYIVKNANDRRHAKHIAMQRHDKKIGGLKQGEQYGSSNTQVKELNKEETQTVSDLLEQIATAAMMGKDTQQLKKQLRIVRGMKQPVNTSDVEAEEEPTKEPETAVGHSMTAPHETDNIRKQKVHYATEECSKKAKADLDEDQATAEYKVKTYYDNALGKTVTRKVRPHIVTFAGSKKGGQPDVESPGEDEVKEGVDGYMAGDMGGMPSGAPEPFTDDPSVIDPELKKKLKDKKSLNLKEEEEDEHDDLSSESDLEDMASEVKDLDDIIDAYDEDELILVDDEGEEIKEDVNEEALNEVLSRMERMKAKIRFAQSKAKRERKIKIALKTPSSMSTLNGRARKLAVKIIKQRLARKPLNKLSVSEKERIEKVVQKRKKLINRLAMKLVSRVKKIEQTRLHRGK